MRAVPFISRYNNETGASPKKHTVPVRIATDSRRGVWGGFESYFRQQKEISILGLAFIAIL